MAKQRVGVFGDGLMLDYFMLYASEANVRLFDFADDAVISGAKREAELTRSLTSRDEPGFSPPDPDDLDMLVTFELNATLTVVTYRSAETMGMREFTGGTDSRAQSNARELVRDLFS